MFKIYVRGILFNQQGEVLVVKKLANQKIAAGLWLLPGGSVEFGEDVEATLSREFKEEVNVEISASTLLGAKKMIIGDIHWLGLYFAVSGCEDSVQNLEPNKHEVVAWFCLDTLPADVDKIDRSFIQQVLNRKSML